MLLNIPRPDADYVVVVVENHVQDIRGRRTGMESEVGAIA
jgi:hypothetical protein